MARFLRPPDLFTALGIWDLGIEETVELAMAEPKTGAGPGAQVLVPVFNNSCAVVNNPDGLSVAPNGLLYFKVTGREAGTTMLEARLGKQGPVWGYTQVRVKPAGKPTQAGKLTFKAIDSCGIAALDEILATSIREGREYSGLIFQQGQTFGFTRPIRGEPTAALPTEAVVPAGTTIVATYHTHGNAQGSGEIFSPQDRGFHNLRHWTGYLGTPSGAILKFLPKDRAPDENEWLAAFGGKVVPLRNGQP